MKNIIMMLLLVTISIELQADNISYSNLVKPRQLELFYDLSKPNSKQLEINTKEIYRDLKVYHFGVFHPMEKMLDKRIANSSPEAAKQQLLLWTKNNQQLIKQQAAKLQTTINKALEYKIDIEAVPAFVFNNCFVAYAKSYPAAHEKWQRSGRCKK